MKDQRHDRRSTRCLRTTRAIPLAAAFMVTTSVGFAQQAIKPLTNDDVVLMVKNELPEEVILNAIQANETTFDTSASSLIGLKNAGVSPKLIDAMLASAAAKKNPPATSPGSQAVAPGALSLSASGAGAGASSPSVGLAQFGEVVKAMMGGGKPGAPETGGISSLANALGATALPANAQTPVVAFLDGSQRRELAIERTFVAQIKSKSDSLTGIAVDSATKSALQAGIDQVWFSTVSHLGTGIGGSVASDAIWRTSNDVASNVLARHFQPTYKYVWALAGVSSPVAASSSPRVDVAYASLPGINPDEFDPVIVKLTASNSAWRLVGATKAKSETVLTQAPQWQVYSSFIEDRVPATVNKIASGHAQISPAAALTPGEYAVVLRPISKDKKFSGADIALNQGVGLLFNSAWSFSVK
jgi:hypothetical protein